MSIEAFVMNYRHGEASPLRFDAIQQIFDTPGTSWNPTHRCLNVRFSNPDDFVDIFCGCDAMARGEVDGLTIARPILHEDYLSRMFRLLQLDNVMMFYSDEPTPIFHRNSDPTQYPTDLLDVLGVPRFAEIPLDLLHQT